MTKLFNKSKFKLTNYNMLSFAGNVDYHSMSCFDRSMFVSSWKGCDFILLFLGMRVTVTWRFRYLVLLFLFLKGFFVDATIFRSHPYKGWSDTGEEMKLSLNRVVLELFRFLASMNSVESRESWKITYEDSIRRIVPESSWF